MKPRLEAVNLERIVGERAPHAVFAEALRLDAHFAQYRQNGRGLSGVALQLYHHQLTQLVIILRIEIVELDIEIDGESFGFFLIHQCDALKSILDKAVQKVRIAVEILAEELIVCHVRHLLHKCAWREIRQFHPLFLGDAMIVFGFHFQESQVGIEIGANAEFLPRSFVELMAVEHTHLPGVEIHGVVVSHPVAVDFLNEIVRLCFFQQTTQLLPCGHILRVHAVHQFHACHFLQRNGVKFRQ